MIVATHLKSFQALELAIRLGSLKEAADVLAITPAAVGQRIKTLEDYLGIDLVVRGRSGLRPTPELSKALPHLAEAFAALGDAAEILDFQRTNEIHIAASSDWVELWLRERLPAFKRAYPNILFCINGEGEVPMRLGHTDVEIRFSAPLERDRCDFLFRDYLLPVCSVNTYEREELNKQHNVLEDFPLLHLDYYKDDPAAVDWPEWIAAHGHRKAPANRGMRFRQIRSGLDAVLSNAGFMICGLAMVSDAVERGEVKLAFPIEEGAWTSYGFYAEFRADAVRRAQVNRFRDWLLEESRKTRAWLEARVGEVPGMTT